MYKKITLSLLVFLFFAINLQAQLWVDKMHNPNENFYSVQQEFKTYWQTKPYERGKGFKAFKRWEWFTEPRVYPTGDLKLASRAKAYEEFQKYLDANPTAAQRINSTNATTSTGNWTALGPFGSPIGGDAGRVTFIRFHPTISTTMYLGTGAGGMWVSTNGGTSWSTNSNPLSVLGCSDLAINPTTPSIMYLATGDVDSGDNNSVGVLKSTDGGVTWTSTALTFSVSQQRTIGRLLINPLNPNILFAATNAGIYRTNNGGTSWVVVKSGSFKDMEYRPGDTSTVYAVTATTFYKSITGGNTSASFVSVTSGMPTGGARMCVSVTPADPNYVYILSSAADNSFGGVYRSTNVGVSFLEMSVAPNIFGWSTDGSDTGGQGWYDLACGVSPTNKNEIVCGGVNSWKSTDGGANWTLQTHWYGGGGAPYVHADLHAVEYQTGTKLFMGTDGGIAVSSNTGASWTTINGQMNIAQSYRIGQSASTASYVISGHQDNGTNLLNGSTWTSVYGGDGADCFVDWSNNVNLVASYIQGDFQRSSNSGGSWTSISTGLTGSAAWVAPIIQDPNVSTTYYCGYQQVYKSLNKGTTWTQIGTLSGSPQLLYLAAAPSNSLVLYASSSSALFKTTNGGSTWGSIVTGLPTGSAQITQMAVDNTNSDNIFVTFSGYSAGNKVFTSSNGGTSWTNISAGLPNLPVNCVVYQKNSNNAIYVGTDVGVYYKDGSMTTFVPFMTGLPNVVVNDFEIFYPTNKLRAGTYGRGVWESDLYSNPLAPPNAFYSTSSSLCINTSAVLNDQSSNTPTAWSWTLTGASPSISAVKNPTVSYSATGVYTVSLTSSNANGTSTVYSNTIAVVSSPTISVPSATVCKGSTAVLIASGASTYIWSNGSNGGVISISPSVTTVYTCTGSVGACTSIQTTTVTVGLVPPTPTITQTGSVLNSSSSMGNQWYFNGSPIAGATAQTYTSTQDGYYSVWVTSSLGCQSSSNSVYVSTVGLEELTFVNGIEISPNPAKDILFLNSTTKEQKRVSYTIYAVNGQLVKSGNAILNSGKETILISELVKGIYEITFISDKHSSSFKFIKE